MSKHKQYKLKNIPKAIKVLGNKLKSLNAMPLATIKPLIERAEFASLPYFNWEVPDLLKTINKYSKCRKVNGYFQNLKSSQIILNISPNSLHDKTNIHF